MRARRYLCPGVDKVGERGQRSPDTKVVLYLTSGQWDVEVTPHQHTATGQVAQVLEFGQFHRVYLRPAFRAFFVRRVPTIRVRSTSRVE
ncbi:MAG: hypothetical protein MAG471_01743 [Acidimicrobiaceae bacterium]|nr:hypothetical protein [Acidimicrobiaceae bacterium]